MPMPGGRPSTFAAFGYRGYSLLFVAQLLTYTGAWFQNVTLSVLVLEAGFGGWGLAVIAIAQFGPVLLVAAPAGALADRISPRTLLAVAALTQCGAAICLILMVVASPSATGWIVAALTISGIGGSIDRVCAPAFIPRLVPPRLLTSAVALATSNTSVARTIGPGVAGLAILALGPVWCLVINACLYFIAFVVLMAIRGRQILSGPARPETEGGERRGMRTLLRRSEAVLLIAVGCVVAVFIMNFHVSIPALVSIDFDGGAGELGAAHSLTAVGGIIGTIIIARLGTGKIIALVPACLLVGAALLFLGVAPSLAWVLWLAPLLGITLGIYQGALQVAIIVLAPRDLIGRAVSLIVLAKHGLAPLGAIFLGAVIEAGSGQLAMLIGAAAAAVCATAIAIFVLWRRPQLPRPRTA